MLHDKRRGAATYRIPFIVVCDAFQSETTAFADLILPDTTYLERHDAMSMLDRPISEFDGPCDSVRVPVLPPLGDCKPFQEVLVELATAPEAAGLRRRPRAAASTRTTLTSSCAMKPHRAAGIGFLTGWRGEDGKQSLRGAPNPQASGRCTPANNCVHHFTMPVEHQLHAQLEPRLSGMGAEAPACAATCDPITIHIYSEFMQRFRLAAQGKGEGRKPPERLRERVDTYFDPLPFWYPPLEVQASDTARPTRWPQ